MRASLWAVEGPGGAVDAMPFMVHHGEIDALGFRFGTTAYTPDLNAIPDASLGYLEGLDCWIVDALRYTRHPATSRWRRPWDGSPSSGRVARS